MLQSRILSSTIAKETLLVLGGVLLIALFSQISIPLQPVPVTLQTVGVLLIGLTYAPRPALVSMLTYLGLGAMGLPIFANMSAGAHLLVGPTAGFLAAFPVVAYGVAFLRERFNVSSKWGLLGLCVLGQAVFFVFGVSWLSHLMGFMPAIMGGFMPFILPGIAKAILTAAIASYLHKR